MLNVLSLFSWIGADRKALKNIGVKAVFESVEIDKNAVMSYNAIHGANAVPTSVVGYEPTMKDIDLLFHGSPCQDFSLGGFKRGGEYGTNTRSALMWESVRIIETKQPKVVIWENVLGALNTNAFKEYLEVMEILGYKNTWRVLEATDFGLPQMRKRIFCVSTRQELGINFNFDVLETQPMIPLRNFITAEHSHIREIFTLNKKESFFIYAREENGETIPQNYAYTRVWNMDKIVGTLSAGAGRERVGEIIDGKLHFHFVEGEDKWALMGFSREDYSLAKSTGQSNFQLSKQAGNSIAVPVLEAIFKQLYNYNVK